MPRVEFSEDRMKVTVHGRRYRAEPSPQPGRCNDCAFKFKFGCNLSEALYQDDPATSNHMECSANARADGQSINWVLDV